MALYGILFRHIRANETEQSWKGQIKMKLTFITIYASLIWFICDYKLLKKNNNLYTNFSDCLQKIDGKVVSYNSHQL